MLIIENLIQPFKQAGYMSEARLSTDNLAIGTKHILPIRKDCYTVPQLHFVSAGQSPFQAQLSLLL